MRDELITKLQNHNRLTEDECFEVANDICQLLNSTEESFKQDGRNLIIRLLDNWNNIPEGYRIIFVDLISAAGFYPYLKNSKLPVKIWEMKLGLSITNRNICPTNIFTPNKSDLQI